MKRLILLLLFSISAISAYAQQDAQYTQYMYNTVNINPAYAGSRGVLSIFGLHRTQWVGIDGAPVTNSFSLNTPIQNSNIGFGVSVINDRIGPSDETSISADVSYTINTSEKYKLSFGVKATANLLNIDFTRLSIYDAGDALSQYNIDNRFSPNIGAGIYYHSNKSYIGLSVPNFLETKPFDKGQTVYSSNSIASEKMHYYLIAGHVFDLSSSVKLKPTLLTKMVKGAPLQVDLSANFIFNERFHLGGAYRWSAAGSLMAGFQVNSNWFIGYGYDMEVTKLANYNSGSHEFFLRYEFAKKYDKIISPRFF
jgi:type IX secretion system PorP/SprF family membrane protein